MAAICAVCHDELAGLPKQDTLLQVDAEIAGPRDKEVEEIGGVTTQIIAMACGHVYHFLCIKKWIERPTAVGSPVVLKCCPMCNKPASMETGTRLFLQYQTDSPIPTPPTNAASEMLERTTKELNVALAENEDFKLRYAILQSEADQVTAELSEARQLIRALQDNWDANSEAVRRQQSTISQPTNHGEHPTVDGTSCVRIAGPETEIVIPNSAQKASSSSTKRTSKVSHVMRQDCDCVVCSPTRRAHEDGDDSAGAGGII